MENTFNFMLQPPKAATGNVHFLFYFTCEQSPCVGKILIWLAHALVLAASEISVRCLQDAWRRGNVFVCLWGVIGPCICLA